MTIILAFAIGFAQIMLSQDSINFGDMGWQDTSAMIYVTNKGDDTLRIYGVITSCGCTKATVDSDILPPGEKTLLTIEFSPSSHGIKGDVYREVYIRSNSTPDTLVKLQVYAQVTPPKWAEGRTLPDYVFRTSGLLKAYSYVLENRDLISKFPCYCGCRDSEAHNDLAECFVADGEFQSHASTCAVCVAEVLDIKRFREISKSFDEIENYISKTYSIFGKPTQGNTEITPQKRE